MGWENAGPWVYPKCFPPVGGEESFKNAIAMMRERGWHAGSFNSGTRWCFDQVWAEYDGRDYLDEINAEEGFCKTAEGSNWSAQWDYDFRTSYSGCLATKKTRETGLEIIEKQIDFGMESLQFLDQNNGAATFPCFAENHGHPPAPGKWMHESMTSFLREMHSVAKRKGIETVIHSAEAGINETCLPLFQQTEFRVFPSDYGSSDIPLYQYLFHECLVFQGMFSYGPAPYNIILKNATNFVLGIIPGGCLTGDGSLLDKDTYNWATWEPKTENQDEALLFIKNSLALRRGEGRAFLVFGRMERPAEVAGINRIKWESGGKQNDYASVFHSAWSFGDGRRAVALANWTRDPQTVIVFEKRFDPARPVEIFVSADGIAKEIISASESKIEITLPPHSCAAAVQ